jgi:hypothetical protein
MEPAAVLALCHVHAGAEAEGDMERALATMVPDPCFEFFPMGVALSGRHAVGRYYREQFPAFAPSVTGYELLDEWTNERTAIQEYTIGVATGDGGSVTYHVISMMTVDPQTGLHLGERLYCHDDFVRALLGPLTEYLEPIGG